MPAAEDEIAGRRQILVERLGERQAHMWTAVEIAEDLLAASHDETMEAPRLELDDEASGGIRGDLLDRPQDDAGRRFEEPRRVARCRVRVGLAVRSTLNRSAE